jgi:transposase
MSNGEKAVSPDYSKQDRKIRKLQRRLARQQKDSKRRNRTRIKIAKLHNQITDTKKRFLAQTVYQGGERKPNHHLGRLECIRNGQKS